MPKVNLSLFRGSTALYQWYYQPYLPFGCLGLRQAHISDHPSFSRHDAADQIPIIFRFPSCLTQMVSTLRGSSMAWLKNYVNILKWRLGSIISLTLIVLFLTIIKYQIDQVLRGEATRHSQYYVMILINVPLAVGLNHWLLCSPFCNRNFQKKVKGKQANDGRPRSVCGPIKRIRC